MDTSTMFEQASRLKIRYESPLGYLSVEDLWELPLTSAGKARPSLDGIAIFLHKIVRESAETVSFVEPQKTPDRDLLLLRFEIVKHIISVRVKERDEKRAEVERKEKKQRLLGLIARKEDQELEGKSKDELRTMVEAL